MTARVMVISDLHCGHKVGLTPPDWDKRPGGAYDQHERDMYHHRRSVYRWLKETVVPLTPDVVIINGDCIDGRGEKSGSTELVTVDRDEQCAMVVACIQDLFPHNPQFVMSYGTPYHTGSEEDYEKRIAENIYAAKIGAEDDIRIDDLTINYRHHASRSSIPHGRGTPLSKEWLWNMLWNLRGEYPKADILFRSHVHYFHFTGDAEYLAVSTPALQGYGTKFGARRMQGTVDVGVCWVDIEGRKRSLDWAVKRFNKRTKYALVV